MTFIKITDPKQQALARQLHETKRSIQTSNMQHRLDKIGLSRDLSKVFKPMVEAQKEAALKITKSIEDLPAPVLALPPPPEFADPLSIEPSQGTNLSPLAQQYPQTSMTSLADHTFGLRVEDNAIKIGSSPVTFDGNDIFVDGVRYKGTPGLWELMVKKKPETFEPDDLDRYEEILISSGAMYQGNSTLSRTPKSSKSYKWTKIVSHIYKQNKHVSGLQTVFLPSDFDQLLDRLELRKAAYQARNNGVRNEIVAILDVMKKDGYINIEKYKQLSS